jgi:hypothetical protein
MNRAWIPAGALAGVSVAGLIALGPLTDSLNTQVTFPTSIAAAPSTSPAKARSTVPVSITLKRPVGDTSTETASADLTTPRGGRSSATLSTGSDTGEVSFQKFHSTSNGTATASHTASTTIATPPAKPKKKAVKREASIGTIGEQNGDSGLAGGSKGTSSLGEQSGTPSGSAP